MQQDVTKFEDMAALDRSERTLRRLPVALTEPELAAGANEVVRLQSEIAQAETRAEGAKEAAKAVAKAADAEVQTLRLRARERARIVEAKEEEREVEVRVVIDRTNRRRLVVRTDTLAVVEDRPATTEELESGCEWEKDYTKGVARLLYKPTGEIVRTRVLTDEERQLGLDAVAPRELVWVSNAWWTNATEDEKEDLAMPVAHGTRLMWQESGDWRVAQVPVGATLDGLYHRLGVMELPFKVGNDAPASIGDLVGRRKDTGKVTELKGRKSSKVS